MSNMHETRDGIGKVDDEFDKADDEFHAAHNLISQDLSKPIDPKKAEDAARTLAMLAISSGDSLKLAFLLARFEDYVAKARTIPQPLLQAMSDAFMRFRMGGSMDEAFGLKKPRAGRPPSWLQRELARMNAEKVIRHINKGATLEVAVEEVAKGRKASESQIKRDYLRYRRFIKAE